MKVVATRSVFYNGVWYKAAEEFECGERDFPGLEVAGVEKVTALKKKLDKSEKNIKTR